MEITRIKIDGVVYEIEVVAPTIITFTIGSTSYQAEEGMTWEQWVDSSYNTAGYYVRGSYVYDNEGFGGWVRSTSPTDIIVSDGEYLLEYPPHGGGTND